jgi:chorismate mutase
MVNLDDLRIKLDQMSERIVSRLKDRSRMPLNQLVYIPDAIPINGCNGMSFFQFAIKGLEVYHATLGRYEYTDQQPILSTALPKSPVNRISTITGLSDKSVKVSEDLLAFYQTVPPEMCKGGDDPKSYGETVYIDADLIELVHERINSIGKHVAHAKLELNPSILKIASNDQLLKAILRSEKRESAVVEKAKDIATRYDLDTKVTERVFRWLIEETVNTEMSYIKSLARSDLDKDRRKALNSN